MMHRAVMGEEYEDVACFNMNGYVAQTCIYDNEEDYDQCNWAVSGWCEEKTLEARCAANISDKPELAKGLWLMDTGCAHDLIGKKMAEGYTTSRLPRPFTFTTANGSVKSYQSVPMQSDSLECSINPFLLPETPAVLSVGRRCMEEGYSFIWRAGEAPYLETPTGACISLRLERNIPYLDTRDDQTLDADTAVAAVPVAMAEDFEDEQIPKSEHDSDDDDDRQKSRRGR
jgi:hypothetical protein